MHMNILKSHKHTLRASYIGHVTQAIINNFTPLLFLTFEKQYGIPLSKITLLVTVNFLLQLLMDLAAASVVDKLGHRKCIVTAHLLCAIGLVCLGSLPELFRDPFCGILTSLIIYALGGGLIEVLIVPIVEACPGKNKASVMNLLHFFYSAGNVGVVVFSTLFFQIFGISNWRILSCILAAVPLLNAAYFLAVPIYKLPENSTQPHSITSLLRSKTFLLFILLMFLSGASEQSMNQWGSAFAESALSNTSLHAYAKTLGDLLGPCIFAMMMGLSRLICSRLQMKIKLETLLTISALSCSACYIFASVCPNPLVKLIFCGICGLSIGAAWPGIYVLAPRYCRGTGTASFALLALGGDLGCAAGPTLVGIVSEKCGSMSMGYLAACAFPLLLLVGICLVRLLSPDKHGHTS